MRSRQARILLSCIMTPIVLNLTLLRASAEQVEAKASPGLQKKITWDITDKNGSAAQGTVVFEHALHVFAKDKHGGGSKDNPEASNPVEKDFPKLHYSQGADPEQRLGWTKTDEDTKTVGPQLFPSFPQYYIYEGSSHPFAFSSITASMSDPRKVENKDQYLLDVTIAADVTATTTIPPKEHKPETSSAEAFAAGRITIDCGTVVAINGNKPAFLGKNLTTGRLITSGPPTAEASAGGYSSSRKASRKDPLTLGFYDAESGDLIAEQSLWQELWDVDFNGMVDSSETGLTLSTGISGDPTGSASIELTTLGSWIQNPFSGTASLIDGVLTTTGDLAGLPWQVSTVDDVTTASLASADFNQQFEFDVLATGLGDREMTMRLVDEEEDYAFAEASVVPEPGTVILLAAGCLGLARLRRT